MKIILTQDIDTLGIRGDVVEVKNGYGRNYLIPQGMAVVATEGTLKRFAEERRQQAHKVEQRRTDAEALKAKLEGMPALVIPMRTGEENRIFGTVTTQQIEELLQEQGVDIDRKKIALKEDIRMTGVYGATVRLHPEFTADVKVQVVPMQEAI
ncbi:MAG: 50S ribosomal protein L9 [Bacteroidota bacterium]